LQKLLPVSTGEVVSSRSNFHTCVSYGPLTVWLWQLCILCKLLHSVIIRNYLWYGIKVFNVLLIWSIVCTSGVNIYV